MKNEPLVSIIIPVYNGANFMREAIDSALSQTYKNIEIIVVNDGSRDDGETDRIAREYGDKIRYFPKENGGSSSALNKGIREMKGDYFSWLSHDDMYTPDKIERQVKTMLEFGGDNTVCISRGSLINEKGEKIPSLPSKIKELLFQTGQERLKLFLKDGVGINGCAVLIPKEVLKKSGFFREDYVYVNDTDYWIRLMLLDVRFVTHPDVLVKTRVHGAQVSVSKREKYFSERKILFKELADELIKSPSENADLLYDLMVFSLKRLDFSSGKHAKKLLKKHKKGGAFLGFKYIYYCMYGVVRDLLRILYSKLIKRR